MNLQTIKKQASLLEDCSLQTMVEQTQCSYNYGFGMTKEDFKNELLYWANRLEVSTASAKNWRDFKEFIADELDMGIGASSYVLFYEQTVARSNAYFLAKLFRTVLRCCSVLEISLIENIPAYYSICVYSDGRRYDTPEEIQKKAKADTFIKLLNNALWRWNPPTDAMRSLIYSEDKEHESINWKTTIQKAFQYHEAVQENNRGFNMRGLLMKILEQLYFSLSYQYQEVPLFLSCHLQYNEACRLIGHSPTR